MLTQVNPFFIEEALESLVNTAAIGDVSAAWQAKAVHELHIPRSIRDAVQRLQNGSVATPISSSCLPRSTVNALTSRCYNSRAMQRK